MRILLLGDASNFHNALASALRKLGHEVILASNGSGWLNTSRDIDLSRGEGKLGAFKYLFKLMFALSSMRGYDIVQVISPSFLFLRPEKLHYILNYLKRHNGKVVYEALGTDYFYVKDCLECTKFKYSDFRIGSAPSPYAVEHPEEELDWTTKTMEQYANYFINKVDGVITCLYEYYVTYKDRIPNKKLAYGGIPIDFDSIVTNGLTTEPEKVKFFIGIQTKRSSLKGTDKMLSALKSVCAKYPDKTEMCIVENMPYNDYIEKMRSYHVILDQLYSYTPSTNALVAMASGLIAVSGAEPEYYDFIGEDKLSPIVNVSPLSENDIEDKLEWIVCNKHKLPEMSKMGIDFVKKYNDKFVVAKRHLEFWNKI